MTSETLKKRALLFFGVTMVVIMAVIAYGNFVSLSEAGYAASSMAKFDSKGNLMRPVGYREWIYVGTPVTPNELNDGKAAFPEFHSVYIDPASWKHYKKTGKFRDGTILVKELISVGSKAAASGNGYFMGEFIGLEATVKDKKRFSKEPGNWAYFSFTTSHGKPLKEMAEAFPTSSCNACHDGAAAEDWVFTQYYPVLRAVKSK
jgi:hypothetical protein